MPPETSVLSTAGSVTSAPVASDVSACITALTKQLASLQAHVSMLEHQLILLAEPLQKEQQWPRSQAEVSQEKSLKSSQDKSLPVSQDKSVDKEPVIDRRKHPRVLPLVEYGGEGTYVLICPQHGRLQVLPDSPEWFAWLSTLPSFRFVGQQGRFTAFRGYQCSPSTPWWAHRQIRNHSHRRRLGLTAEVSIASLEMAAASLQALV